MWVKICGMTNLQDALLAGELGADAIGFVFAPSKRQVTAAQVGRIAAELPPGVEKVGVFPAWPAALIAATAVEARLDTVQLHGGFDPVLAQDLRAHGIRVIQTLQWKVGEGTQAQELEAPLSSLRGERPGQRGQRILIDSSVGSATGGTGTAFPWAAAQPIFQAHGSGLNLILAGGLRPENVTQAIDLLHPWGVDVVSGVESAAGKKDPERLALFLQRARSAGLASGT